jgi:hypothetical protein
MKGAMNAPHHEEKHMSRFILFVYPDKNANLDAGPTPDVVEKMTRFNEELAKAGVLLALDGLSAPSQAARVSFNGDKPKVMDGPFAEAKELVGGYWVLQCKTREEAIAWAQRAPMPNNSIIEVRKIMDLEDHSPAVQKAAKSDLVREVVEKNQRH